MVIDLFTRITVKFAQVVNEIPGTYSPVEDLESDINELSFRVITVAIVALVVLILIAVSTKNVKSLKMPLFALIALVMGGSTLVLIGSTVYLNISADSGGPVHWHADIEYWACGNELEMRDPTGFLSNKIGTSVLHEHDDHRIHLEGVVVDDKVDASLGKFMYVIGGAITDSALVVPLNAEEELTFEDEFDGDGPSAPNPGLVDPFILSDGDNGRLARFISGQKCGEQRAEVQTFVYQYDEDTKTYQQFKLGDDVQEYVITDDPNVPPGDCIIFEFDVPKEQTDKLCEQYGIRDIDRCEEFGVEPNQREICEIKQLNYTPSSTIQQLPINETESTDESAAEELIDTESNELEPLLNVPADSGLEEAQ